MSRKTALLVGAAPGRNAPEVIASLAGRADVVVAVDGGAAACLDAGVSPAYVIGDLDSLDSASLARVTATGTEVVRFPAEKDETDLDLALAFVESTLQVTHVVVTGVLADRVDHTFASAGSLCRATSLEIEVIERGLNGWVLTERSSPLQLSGAGATVSVMAVTAPARVTLSGVRWPLTHHLLQPASSLGLSNVITTATATLAVDSGSVLVLSPAVDGAKPAGRTSRQTP